MVTSARNLHYFHSQRIKLPRRNYARIVQYSIALLAGFNDVSYNHATSAILSQMAQTIMYVVSQYSVFHRPHSQSRTTLKCDWRKCALRQTSRAAFPLQLARPTLSAVCARSIDLTSAHALDMAGRSSAVGMQLGSWMLSPVGFEICTTIELYHEMFVPA